jgi:hypothetical protein
MSTAFAQTVPIVSVSVSGSAVAWALEDGAVWVAQDGAVPREIRSELGRTITVQVTERHLVVGSHSETSVGRLQVFDLGDADAATVFNADGSQVGDKFGAALGSTAEDDLLCVGAPNAGAGAGALFVYNTSSWELLFALEGTAGAQLGAAVAIRSQEAVLPGGGSHREAVAVVAAPGAAEVEVYVIGRGDRAAVGAFVAPPNETVTALALSGHSLLFATVSNQTGAASVHHTAFCPRNYKRAHRFTEAPAFECHACPPGHASAGGLMESCTKCDSVKCFSEGEPIRIVQTDPGNLTTGTSVQLKVGVAREGEATEYSYAMSEPSVFDPTPPVPAQVIDGVGSPECLMCDPATYDSQAQSNADSLTVSWEAFSDPESGIAGYEVCWGSTSGACDEVPVVEIWNTTVNALTVMVELRVGARYYATVSAMNKALLWANASSDGLTVDQSAPRMLDIRDGFGDRDISTQVMTNLLISRWVGEDDDEGVPVFFHTRILGCNIPDPNGDGKKPEMDVLEWDGTEWKPKSPSEKRRWTCSDCDTRERGPPTLNADGNPGGKFPRGEPIGLRKEDDFGIMQDYTWARDRQVYGFVDFGGGYIYQKNPTHLEAGECYYTEARATNEAGYFSEPMITNGVLVGSSEAAVDPSSPDPVGMMFDTGPADVKPRGASSTNETKGNPASPDKPLVGAFTMPSGAVDGPVTMSAGRVPAGEGVDAEETMPSGLTFGAYSFEIGVADESGARIDGFVFAIPATISIAFDPETLLAGTGQPTTGEAKCIPELMLYDVYSQSWINAEDSCPAPGNTEPLPLKEIDYVSRLMHVQVCHLTQFSVAINIDDCLGNRCVAANSQCIDGREEYFCECHVGWEGTYCQSSVDDCPGNFCQNASPCVDVHLNYTCACPTGWGGWLCDATAELAPLLSPTEPPPPPDYSVSPMLLFILMAAIICIAVYPVWKLRTDKWTDEELRGFRRMLRKEGPGGWAWKAARLMASHGVPRSAKSLHARWTLDQKAKKGKRAMKAVAAMQKGMTGKKGKKGKTAVKQLAGVFEPPGQWSTAARELRLRTQEAELARLEAELKVLGDSALDESGAKEAQLGAAIAALRQEVKDVQVHYASMPPDHEPEPERVQELQESVADEWSAFVNRGRSITSIPPEQEALRRTTKEAAKKGKMAMKAVSAMKGIVPALDTPQPPSMPPELAALRRATNTQKGKRAMQAVTAMQKGKTTVKPPTMPCSGCAVVLNVPEGMSIDGALEARLFRCPQCSTVNEYGAAPRTTGDPAPRTPPELEAPPAPPAAGRPSASSRWRVATIAARATQATGGGLLGFRAATMVAGPGTERAAELATEAGTERATMAAGAGAGEWPSSRPSAARMLGWRAKMSAARAPQATDLESAFAKRTAPRLLPVTAGEPQGANAGRDRFRHLWEVPLPGMAATPPDHESEPEPERVQELQESVADEWSAFVHRRNKKS